VPLRRLGVPRAQGTRQKGGVAPGGNPGKKGGVALGSTPGTADRGQSCSRERDPGRGAPACQTRETWGRGSRVTGDRGDCGCQEQWRQRHGWVQRRRSSTDKDRGSDRGRGQETGAGAGAGDRGRDRERDRARGSGAAGGKRGPPPAPWPRRWACSNRIRIHRIRLRSKGRASAGAVRRGRAAGEAPCWARAQGRPSGSPYAPRGGTCSAAALSALRRRACRIAAPRPRAAGAGAAGRRLLAALPPRGCLVPGVALWRQGAC